LLSLLFASKQLWAARDFVITRAHGQASSYSFDLIYAKSFCLMVTQPLLHTLSQAEPTTELWEANSISHAGTPDSFLTSIPLTS
jgi:hypothetical protein